MTTPVKPKTASLTMPKDPLAILSMQNLDSHFAARAEAAETIAAEETTAEEESLESRPTQDAGQVSSGQEEGTTPEIIQGNTFSNMTGNTVGNTHDNTLNQSVKQLSNQSDSRSGSQSSKRSPSRSSSQTSHQAPDRTPDQPSLMSAAQSIRQSVANPTVKVRYNAVTFKIHPGMEEWVNEHVRATGRMKQDVLNDALTLYKNLVEEVVLGNGGNGR